MFRLRSVPSKAGLVSLRCRNLASSRSLAADQNGSGFGAKERQEKGAETPKDTAPYQNEYTSSGTNSEVAHNSESYSSNTDPAKSNDQEGGALDSSPANPKVSRNAESNESNKSDRDRSAPGGYNQKTKGSSSSKADGQDTSKDKFDKISKGHDDIQTVGGRTANT